MGNCVSCISQPDMVCCFCSSKKEDSDSKENCGNESAEPISETVTVDTSNVDPSSKDGGGK